MDDKYLVMTLSPLRKVVAARMSEAKSTVPHFRLGADIEADALLALRKELQVQDRAACPSLNDMLIKACALALMDTPEMNVQWHEGEIRRYETADISVVTALPDGLSTPIIRNAEVKSIWEISREVRELTARAARNALKVHEVFGGTFSISNLGMYGVDEFDAIINPPQSAILAVGTAKPRCVATPEFGMRVATVLRLTLSIDHRPLDGVVAARFLSALRERIERPEQLVRGSTGQ
jgi:pyruvate dehydrogenase E2 component (dihydrolipoamide acetyltransferase)